MFPFPKLDNKTILIISVVLLLYILTFEKTPDPIKKIVDNSSKAIKEVSNNATALVNDATTIVNNAAENNYNTAFSSNFTQQRCVPGVLNCDEDFTQEKECPTLDEQLSEQVLIQNKTWEKARNTGLPFPKDDGPTTKVSYIGKNDDTWFNDTQYDTIQKIIEDPSRQMKATQGNVIPAGGDTRDWPFVKPTNQQVAALILQSLPTKGNNVQMNTLEA